MTVYCDSSFFFRQIISSTKQVEAVERAARLVRDHGHLPITTFTRLEVIQALRFDAWLNKNDRNKGTSVAKINQALSLFLAEIGTTFHIIPIDWERTYARAELLTRTTSEEGWRMLDIIHVTAALESGAKSFYTFDRLQNDLAAREGLETPLSDLI